MPISLPAMVRQREMVFYRRPGIFVVMLSTWLDDLEGMLEGLQMVAAVHPAAPPAGCVYAGAPKLVISVEHTHLLTVPHREGGSGDLRLPAGTCACFIPGAWHQPRRGRRRRYASISVFPDYLRLQVRRHDGRSPASGPTAGHHIARPQDAVLDHVVAGMVAAAQEGISATTTDLARVWLRRAIVAFRSHPPTQPHEPDWLAVMAYLEAYVQQPLTRDGVARACGMHPSTLSALCRRSTGRRFIDVLTDVRMRHAARLLSEHGLGVAETAAALDFCDVRHFRRVFTRVHGRSPSSFRPEKPVRLQRSPVDAQPR